MNLTQLKALFVSCGCTKLYAKPLAENDNSKNQVYFGPDFQALNLFPNKGVIADSSKENPIFKAALDFAWVTAGGGAAIAPGAQLILYPQYPEVRFSGFLKGCEAAPSDLMAGRHAGRILFLGVTRLRQVRGFVVSSVSPVAAEFHSLSRRSQVGVFSELPLTASAGETDSRSRLLAELSRIHRLHWIESKQLDSDGSLTPCNAAQCGGFTLEAELGIPKNSDAEPDFLGWEVKQHAVSNFAKVEVGTITLMTPEPTGGFYKDEGVEAFVRKFGYPDKMGRIDRLNFGGIHKFGVKHPTTNLTLILEGYNATDGRIINADGCIALVTEKDTVAASWAFSGLLAHWARKHSKAVYVPSRCRKEPKRQYCYGNNVRLAQGTDSLHLLKALASGAVYYDPGIKLEHASEKPTTKRRSQFRIASRSLSALYNNMELVAV